MKINLSFILFLVVVSFISCIKEFQPHANKYGELLVVEGAITDKPGPYTIKLSKSGPVLESSQYKPYSKCAVEIMDNSGNDETLTEVSEGVYKTDSLAGIQGIVGGKYKIKISTPEGELYESQEEVLKKGVSIQSVYAEYEHKTGGSFFGRDGYQFYLDTETPTTDTNCYLWSLESTYKFQTDFSIHEYYEGGGIIKPFPNPDSLRTGYRTQQIKEIYTLNTGEQSQKQVQRFPLWYEDNYTKALKIRYCLKVDQYTLPKNAYTYWNTIRKMNADQGALYTQQPYQVKGNVVSVNNPAKPALGYFMVAGMDEKRIFVDPLYVFFRYPVCTLPTPSKVPLMARLQNMKPKDWPVYISSGFIVGLDISPRCADCRVEGFLKKPNYWID